MSHQDSLAPFRVLIAGCGGQGVLSATKALGDAARSVGIPLRAGQLHGLAQRGGMVEGTLVMGPGRTGFIGPGQADLVLGLEPLETQRTLSRMSKETRVLLCPQAVPLPLLAWQGKHYPSIQQIVREIHKITPHVWILDATSLAHQLGNPKVQNVVMLGGLAALNLLAFDADVLQQAVDAMSPESFFELNHKAFELGRTTMAEILAQGSVSEEHAESP